LLANVFVPRLRNKLVVLFMISLGSIICQIGAYIISPFWGICSSWVPVMCGSICFMISQPFVNVNAIPYIKRKIASIIKLNEMEYIYTNELNK
jgi:uncharacterized membrane protein YdjX (TVP38/TMEM64 family)